MKKLLLSLLALALIAPVSAQELFISEVVEGSSHNKAFEIYNPSDSDVDLSGYVLSRYNNGALTASGGTLALSGTVASGDVWVIANGVSTPDQNGAFCDSILQGMADQLDSPVYPSPSHNNGNDAITLEKDGVIIDIFGQIGDDPGSAWGDATGKWWTRDHTLIRKPEVNEGVTTNPTAFDVTLEWDSLPINTWDSLGFHRTAQPANVANPIQKENLVFAFPNPSNDGNFTIKATEWVSKVTVFNLAGQVVETKENNTTYGAIPVSINQKGMYILRVQLKDGTVATKKVSVQ